MLNSQYNNPNNYSGIGGSFSSNPTALFGNPATFTAAADTQAGDYDSIMAQYKKLASTPPITATPTTYTNITPQATPYTQSTDVTNSLSKLSDLATTGGYSAADKANILARDVSPTRSIYASAQQDAQRQKALSGGYSPNSGAVSEAMARDESNQIGGIETAANAGIAQNVAANEIAAAPQYASASASANAAKTAADQANTAIINEINSLNAKNKQQTDEFNTGEKLQADTTNKQADLSAIGGQTSLYGTTPALTKTFGDQVTQAGQLSQNQRQMNLERQRQLLGYGLGG